MPPRLIPTTALALLALLTASPAVAQRTRSIGTPSNGSLASSVRLEETEHLRLQPSSRPHFWTTDHMSGLLRRAAARVREAQPGPRLMVGALSLRRGGRLEPHASHQNGRDADFALFLLDAHGEPVEARRFVTMGQDGCGEDRGERYCLDGARTFALLAAMLEDPEARVQWFLLAEDLRARVLAAGRRAGADPAVVSRVALVTEPHAASEHHRDHVHVRIYCSVADRPECLDTAPYHPWYEGVPPRVDRARSRRRARRARQRRARRRRARQRRRRARRRRRRRR